MTHERRSRGGEPVGRGVAVSGLYLTRRMTGMERYAHEVVKALDDIVQEEDHWSLIVPSGLATVPSLRRIAVRKKGQLIGPGKLAGYAWEETSYAAHLRRTGSLGLCFLNTVPVFAPESAVVVHDLAPFAHPEYFSMGRKRWLARYLRWNMRYLKKRSSAVVTVSEFSRDEAAKHLGLRADDVVVASPGWQHIKNIDQDRRFFSRNPRLAHQSYYMCLSNATANKNFQWIARAAKNNPDQTFAIAGGGNVADVVVNEIGEMPPNLVHLGYVTDEELKTAIGGCKAFIFPSHYEGFGIPPLEAAACGVPTIVADIPPMREIFRASCAYIDPDEEVARLPTPPMAAGDDVLERYDWAIAARRIYERLQMWAVVNQRC